MIWQQTMCNMRIHCQCLDCFQTPEAWENRALLVYQRPLDAHYGGFVKEHFSAPYSSLLVNLDTRIAVTGRVIQWIVDNMGDTVQHPGLRRNHTLCTAMELGNLAEPRWTQVQCSQKYQIRSVVCMETKQTKDVHHKQTKLFSCKHRDIMNGSVCFNFGWVEKHKANHSLLDGCEESFLFPLTNSNLAFLYDTIASVLPPLLFENKFPTGGLQRFQYQRHLNTYTTKIDTVPLNMAQGYFVCPHKTIYTTVPPNSNVFLCKDGTYISSLYLCDYHAANTVRNCHPEYCTKVHQKVDESCPVLFYTTNNGSCQKYIGEDSHFKPKKNASRNISFACGTGRKIDFDLVNDLIVDCLDGEDEPLLAALLLNNNATVCKHAIEMSCKENVSVCFSIEDICQYSLSEDNILHPCRIGGHLDNCIHFECNMRFKCPASYCILWDCVCDEKWDCPEGNEEMNCERNNCEGMFKCHRTLHMCIHLGSICNGFYDCPFSDDESHCELHRKNCPGECLCLLLGIHCKNFAPAQQYEQYIFVSIYKTHNYDAKHHKEQFPNAIWAQLSHCHIAKICNNYFNSKVLVLDVSSNDITVVHKDCFSRTQRIKVLNLTGNSVSIIESLALIPLNNLTFLDLSKNPLVLEAGLGL